MVDPIFGWNNNGTAIVKKSLAGTSFAELTKSQKSNFCPWPVLYAELCQIHR